ncbi:MAG: hypothetical protein E6Q97_30105 [Desulfurellales bacterium]|nr:MAG: hypothetical protein E6Q97_30105 [Desulfurellales bacterium]
MRLILLHPEIARIDCEDCKKFAYNMKTGERFLHGKDPIPVREPPCAKDDKICRKVRPGYSDLSEENMRIVADIEFFEQIGKIPDDPEFHRYRKIVSDVRRSVEAARAKDEQYDMLLAMVKSRR